MLNTLQRNPSQTDTVNTAGYAHRLLWFHAPFVRVRKVLEQPQPLKSRCLPCFFTISGQKEEGEKRCMLAIINQGPDPDSTEVNRKVSIDVSKCWDGPPELGCMLTAA